MRPGPGVDFGLVIPVTLRQGAGLLVAAMCVACGTRETTVEFYSADGYRFSRAERGAIEDMAEATAVEARRVLPSLPQRLVVRVYPEERT